MARIDIHNIDCLQVSIPDDSVNLFICDPPFGIGEANFEKHYKRAKDGVTNSYVEAPVAYETWTRNLLAIASKKLRNDGTIYVVSGWTRLGDVLNAIRDCGNLHTINHCIWKYNFGVYTTNKFVSSHYHILMLSKSQSPKFNTHCRFGPHEAAGASGGKALYQDLEDVFVINKEYKPAKHGVIKNINKLPDALVEKLIMYSSNPGDMVCDFFMGNFTTAYNALRDQISDLCLMAGQTAASTGRERAGGHSAKFAFGGGGDGGREYGVYSVPYRAAC